MKKPLKKYLPLLIVLVFALIHRGLFLFIYSERVEADHAVTGLMAMHILKGEFPVFFYAQAYKGSIEAYIIAVLFYILGIGPTVLKIVPLSISILYVYLTYELGKNITGDEEGGIYCSLLAAASPAFLTIWSLSPSPAYNEILILGSIILLLTSRIISLDLNKGENLLERKRLLIIMGLLSGIGLWTDLMIIYYLASIALILFIKDKSIILKKEFYISILFFIIGNFPFLIYNILHSWATFKTGRLAGIAEAGNISQNISEFFIPSIINIIKINIPRMLDLSQIYLPRGYYILSIEYPALLIYIVSLIFIFAFLNYFIRRYKFFIDALLLKRQGANGLEMIILLFFFTLIIFSSTSFARYTARDYGTETERFLFPLYNVFPILFGYLLVSIKRYSKLLTLLICIIISFFYIYGNIKNIDLIKKGDLKNYIQLIDTSNLIDLLRSRNIRFAYCDDKLGNRITFETKEEIICAESLINREEPIRYPKYAYYVDSVADPSLILPVYYDSTIENILVNMGVKYEKIYIQGIPYVLYTSFKVGSKSFNEIKPDGWKASSSNPLSFARYAFDRDMRTRWSSMKEQKPGMYFQIDLGELYNVSRILILFDDFTDAPNGLRLELSMDGVNWKKVSEISVVWKQFFRLPHPFLRLEAETIDISFEPYYVRYIRFTQIGEQWNRFSWSVNEIFVYEGKGEVLEDNIPLDDLYGFLKENKICRVYADYTLSIKLWWKSNFMLNVYRFEYDEKDFNQLSPPKNKLTRRKINITSDTAFIIRKEQVESFELVLKQLGANASIERVGPYYIYYTISLKERHYKYLPKENWEARSNYNQSDVKKAYDNDIDTRWSSKIPEKEGMYYEIDLGRLEKISGMIIHLGDSINDFPRELKIELSRNGERWEAVRFYHAGEPGELYWSGYNLLYNFLGYGNVLKYYIEPVTARYIRLNQMGFHDINYWSIHEIEIFE